MKTKEQFIATLMHYFGLITEALRSDQSYEDLRSQIGKALDAWPARPSNDMSVLHTFPDRVVAYSWREAGPNQAWEIPYSRADDGAISFGDPIEVKRITLYEPVSESAPVDRRPIRESIAQQLTILAESQSGARRVRAIGVTADVVNGNGRRYPRPVLADAIARLNSKLNESAGQGRLILTGEAEHPSDKGAKPNILETVVKWEAASLDAAGHVLLEGEILPTSKGRDVATLIEHGVQIDVSQRGYGTLKSVNESGQTVQEVDWLEITGYDLVSQASDPNARLIESQNLEEQPMNLEELLKLLNENPEMLEALKSRLSLADRAALAETLGVEPGKLDEALADANKAKATLAETKRAMEMAAAISEATKNLPYGDLNEQFVDSVMASAPDDPAGVPAVVEAKRKEYDAILAKAKLASQGKVEVRGPVFEQETGQAAYTQPAHEITERLVERGFAIQRNLPESTASSDLFARRYLDAFDEAYQHQLIAEAKLLEEAETTTDLNLPYSVSRAIVAEALPELVAASVFDMGMASSSPTRIYFEQYAAESGLVTAVTGESVTSVQGSWVALANNSIVPGTVVVTSKTEYTDYVIDYTEGKIYAITAGGSWTVGYSYSAVRGGEMSAIQRGKAALSFQTVELAADRLAQQISDEAVTFARTQLGWDATGRTLSMLVRELRSIIDQRMIRMGLASAHVAANTGGTWTNGTDALSVLIEKIGLAKIAVQQDNYEPRFILCSLTNADLLENYLIGRDASMASNISGARSVLGAGATGITIKGLPVYASKHMPDSKILVHHPELVQHRVLESKPLAIKGPFPTYSGDKLVAAEQYYMEEYNGDWSLIPAKGGYVTVA